MNVQRESEDGTVALFFADELTISSAQELKEVLLREFHDPDTVALDLGKVTKIDLACLQLFCSAHRSFQKTEKALVLAGPLPGSLRQILDESGLSHHLDGVTDCDQTCLWNGGEENGENHSCRG